MVCWEVVCRCVVVYGRVCKFCVVCFGLCPRESDECLEDMCASLFCV